MEVRKNTCEKEYEEDIFLLIYEEDVYLLIYEEDKVSR